MSNTKVLNTKIITTSVLFSTMCASTSVMAIETGDILVNARILNVSPTVDGNQLMSGGTPFSAPAGIDVDDAYSLGIDITYMVTTNFGVELMLDTTSKHDINGTGNLSGLDIGTVTVLPPSVLATWYFMPKNYVRPYVGAGVNYTFFMSESTTSDLDNALGGNTGLDVDNAFGFVAQAGVDIDINKDWYVTLDAKYIDMDTSATVTVDGVEAATVDFDVNPLVLGVGIGTSF